MSAKVETYAAKIEGPAKFLGFGKQVREVGTDEFRKRFEQARQQQRQAQGRGVRQRRLREAGQQARGARPVGRRSAAEHGRRARWPGDDQERRAEGNHGDRRVPAWPVASIPRQYQLALQSAEHDADAVRGARARRPDPAHAAEASWRHRSSQAMPSWMPTCARAGRPATSASSNPARAVPAAAADRCRDQGLVRRHADAVPQPGTGRDRVRRAQCRAMPV